MLATHTDGQMDEHTVYMLPTWYVFNTNASPSSRSGTWIDNGQITTKIAHTHQFACLIMTLKSKAKCKKRKGFGMNGFL